MTEGGGPVSQLLGAAGGPADDAAAVVLQERCRDGRPAGIRRLRCRGMERGRRTVRALIAIKKEAACA